MLPSCPLGPFQKNEIGKMSRGPCYASLADATEISIDAAAATVQ